jgi:ATP sulfurylase
LTTGQQTSRIDLISPYGDTLVDLTLPEEAAHELNELKEYASHLASLRLSERAVCDLELLACGAFSPLDRFMGKADHERVLQEMRLVTGHIFPIPVTLPLEAGSDVRLDEEVALRDSRNELSNTQFRRSRVRRSAARRSDETRDTGVSGNIDSSIARYMQLEGESK